MFAMAVLGAAIAAADVPHLPAEYTLICEPRLTVGMTWSGGGWHKVEFQPQSFMVTRSLENKCSGDLAVMNSKLVDVVSVCMNIRPVGAKLDPLQTEICKEYYTPTGKYAGTEIYCAEGVIRRIVEIRPDGEFERADLQADLSPKPDKDIKEPQAVETGHCSLVK